MPDPSGSRFLLDRPLQGVISLTMNRPERINTFDLSMVEEANRAWDAIEADQAARVVILRSALPRVFSAGGDIGYMHTLDLEAAARFVYAGHELLRRWERSPKVVIAAVDGFALGGGTEIAAACDLIVASTTAVFGVPEVSLGVFPGWGGTQRLPRLLGISRGKDLVLTGRRIDAQEAYAMGLVNRLCEPEQLDEEALDLAKAILVNGPWAVMRAKRVIVEGTRVSLDQGLVMEAEAWIATVVSPQRAEGMSAFLEKRAPRFPGALPREA